MTNLWTRINVNFSTHWLLDVAEVAVGEAVVVGEVVGEAAGATEEWVDWRAWRAQVLQHTLQHTSRKGLPKWRAGHPEAPAGLGVLGVLHMCLVFLLKTATSGRTVVSGGVYRRQGSAYCQDMARGEEGPWGVD